MRSDSCWDVTSYIEETAVVIKPQTQRRSALSSLLPAPHSGAVGRAGSAAGFQVDVGVLAPFSVLSAQTPKASPLLWNLRASSLLVILRFSHQRCSVGECGAVLCLWRSISR